MKTRVAMMISIAGVLVAGSAAALVNTQVLGGSSSPAGAAAANTVVAEAPVVTTPTVPSAPSVSVESVAPAAASPSQASYSVGTSGMVTLDTAGDVLTIVNVVPAAGWTVSKSETDDATNVEVRFQSDGSEVDFHANLLFGVVTTSVESDDGSTPTGSIVQHQTVVPVVNDDNGRGGSDD
ncbi:MAG: hypothetical protein ABI949_13225 [Ilumatobacteraceae bacterium]